MSEENRGLDEPWGTMAESPGGLSPCGLYLMKETALQISTSCAAAQVII